MTQKRVPIPKWMRVGAKAWCFHFGGYRGDPGKIVALKFWDVEWEDTHGQRVDFKRATVEQELHRTRIDAMTARASALVDRGIEKIRSAHHDFGEARRLKEDIQDERAKPKRKGSGRK